MVLMHMQHDKAIFFVLLAHVTCRRRPPPILLLSSCSADNSLQAGELAAQEVASERACRFWTQGSLLGAFNQWVAAVEVRSFLA